MRASILLTICAVGSISAFPMPWLQSLAKRQFGDLPPEFANNPAVQEAENAFNSGMGNSASGSTSGGGTSSSSSSANGVNCNAPPGQSSSSEIINGVCYINGQAQG